MVLTVIQCIMINMHGRLLIIAAILTCSIPLTGCVVDEGHLPPPSTEPPPDDVGDPQGDITVTSSYQRRDIHGWTVLVNPVMNDHPELEHKTMSLLEDHLYRITRRVPPPALTHLKNVEIWVEYDMPKTQCMCYHVSRNWLIPNGYNPDKEGTVEVGNAVAFLEWTHGQPWMVLHELAHAYHDQILGYEHPGIHAAWKARLEAGDYEEVLHVNGTPRRHYALTNDKEYFAETTEAYFGTNDFHPFVRAELEQVDPAGAALMRETWQINTD